MKNKNRTLRACQECGKPFYGACDCYYCEDCAKLKKVESVIKIRKCIDCGIEFYGGPKSKRCNNCRIEARRKRDREHKKRGTARPLGSIDKCQRCGAEYEVKSGLQKYCNDCARDALLDWQKGHKKGYNKKSGQDVKKYQRRKSQNKICVYCEKSFKTGTSSNLCSDYCRQKQRQITQCKADIKRGQKRNLDKLIQERENYRKEAEQK